MQRSNRPDSLLGHFHLATLSVLPQLIPEPLQRGFQLRARRGSDEWDTEEVGQEWLFGYVTGLFRVLRELRVRLWCSGSRGRGRGRLFAFHKVIIGSGVTARSWHSFGRSVIVIEVRGVDEAEERYRRERNGGQLRLRLRE